MNILNLVPLPYIQGNVSQEQQVPLVFMIIYSYWQHSDMPLELLLVAIPFGEMLFPFPHFENK